MGSELGRCPTFARLRMLLDRQPSDLWLGASGSRMRFENFGNVFLGSEVDGLLPKSSTPTSKNGKIRKYE